MTQLEAEAWKIGMKEAIKHSRMVPVAQSEEMTTFLRQHPTKNYDCLPWLLAYNRGMAAGIELQLPPI